MAISFGGLTWASGSGNIVGLFVCPGVLLILLGLQQAFTIGTTVTRRIVPVELFKSRTMLFVFACTSAAGTACFVPVYFVPLFFQFTRGDGALDAGVGLLTFIIPCIVMICVNDGVMSAYGLYVPWYTTGGEALSCSLVAPFSTPSVLTQALPTSTDTASLPALALECISKPRSQLLKLLSPFIWWLVPQDSSPVPRSLALLSLWLSPTACS
jgi:hypothetical protein